MTPDQAPTGAAVHHDVILLHAYVDGELGPAERAAVARHLADCAACRGRVLALRAFFADLEALPDLPPSRDLAPAVLAALGPARRVAPPSLPSTPDGLTPDPAGGARSRRWRWLGAGLLAVALALALATALALMVLAPMSAVADPTGVAAESAARRSDAVWLVDLSDRLATADAALGARAEALADSAAADWRPELAWARLDEALSGVPALTWAIGLAVIALVVALVNGALVLSEPGIRPGRPRRS
jgi:hypothetical protein